MKLFYSMLQVCELFGVARSTIDRWERECGFPPRVYLGHVAPVRLHDKTTRRYLRTKRSNCRIGFPKAEVDAWTKARMDARAPLKEGHPSF